MKAAVKALWADPAIAQLLGEFAAADRRRAAEAAKADPRTHKLSKVFEQSTAYRYWRAGRDGRGREVRFCWSSHRNVAGYFLAWREVRGKSSGRRDQWSAKKTRKAARALAEKRRDAWQAAQAKRLAALGAPEAGEFAAALRGVPEGKSE